MNQSLSRSACGALRGIAILIVILANFCHKLPGAIKSNEFRFYESSWPQFANELADPDTGFFSQIFSFWGPTGVAIFVLLSGFGLVKKYEQNPKYASTPTRTYLWGNLKKLWLLLIPGSLMFFAAHCAVNHLSFFGELRSHALQFVFLANPVHGAILPYVFWYLGMALQLYVVYWFIFRNRSDKRLLAAVIVQILVQWAVLLLPIPRADSVMGLLGNNFFSWMMVFSLGIYIGRHGLPEWLMHHRLVSALVLLGMMFGAQIVSVLWPFYAVANSMFFVLLVKSVSESNPVMKALTWVGGISAMIYIAHPTMRALFLPLSSGIDDYLIIAAFVASSILLARVLAIVYRRLP